MSEWGRPLYSWLLTWRYWYAHNNSILCLFVSRLSVFCLWRDDGILHKKSFQFGIHCCMRVQRNRLDSKELNSGRNGVAIHHNIFIRLINFMKSLHPLPLHSTPFNQRIVGWGGDTPLSSDTHLLHCALCRLIIYCKQCSNYHSLCSSSKHHATHFFSYFLLDIFFPSYYNAKN